MERKQRQWANAASALCARAVEPRFIVIFENGGALPRRRRTWARRVWLVNLLLLLLLFMNKLEFFEHRVTRVESEVRESSA